MESFGTQLTGIIVKLNTEKEELEKKLAIATRALEEIAFKETRGKKSWAHSCAYQAYIKIRGIE